MVQGCGSQMVKFIIFGTNALLAILGLALLGFGLFALFDEGASQIINWDKIGDLKNLSSTYGKDIEGASQFQIAMYALIIIGGLVFVVSFFGCCGAFMENRLALSIYFGFMLILFIIGVLAAVFAIFIVTGGDIKVEIQEMIGNTTDTELTKIQEQLDCCGPGWEKNQPRLTVACDTTVEQIGCSQASYDLIKMGGLAVGIVGVVMALVQMFVLCFVCCLIVSITHQKRSVTLY